MPFVFLLMQGESKQTGGASDKFDAFRRQSFYEIDLNNIPTSGGTADTEILKISDPKGRAGSIPA